MKKLLDTNNLKGLVEALVFAADAPLKAERIAEVLEVEKAQVLAVLKMLRDDGGKEGRGIVLCEVAGGYQFRTRPEHREWIRRFHHQRPFRFSRAALETLAIIAYRQPITRAEVEHLRGVDSGGVVKTLLEKRLIRILGKKDIAGRPIIYGTSREFLELFGLRDLSGLPTLREFSDLAEEEPVTGDE